GRRRRSPFPAPLAYCALGEALARAAFVLPAPATAAVIASLGEKFESQRARDRRRLDQAHGDAVAEPMGLATAVADQRVAILVVAEIFAADGARRNETVGAGVVELDEQAGASDARNVSLEAGAAAVGEKMGEQAVEGFALGLHGTAFGRRDLRADLAQRCDVLLLRQRAGADFHRTQQAAMDDEVGVAADRRGEMGVAAQV